MRHVEWDSNADPLLVQVLKKSGYSLDIGRR